MQTLEYKNADRACFKTRKIANQSYQGAAFKERIKNYSFENSLAAIVVCHVLKNPCEGNSNISNFKGVIALLR